MGSGIQEAWEGGGVDEYSKNNLEDKTFEEYWKGNECVLWMGMNEDELKE